MGVCESMGGSNKKFKQHMFILSILVAIMLMIIPSISAVESPVEPLPSIVGTAIVIGGGQSAQIEFVENGVRGLSATLIKWMEDILEQLGLTAEDLEALGLNFAVGIFSTVTIGQNSINIRAIGRAENPMTALILALISFSNQYNK